ncbi:MAG: DNA circularization N-terminal domain-containing protein [Promethearchaeota archaeon]
MSWRDRLYWAEESSSTKKKASFRDAFFFVKDSEMNVGRRNIIHQFPFQDEAYVEDLGMEADTFLVIGYVVQHLDNSQDYIDERDDLLEALREFGEGTLKHPFYGELSVHLVGKAKIDESFSEGGIARFTMNFIEVKEGSGTVSFQDSNQNNISAVDESGGTAMDLARSGFAQRYNP